MARFSISGLFGHFNYELHIRENGITILTGPNGYGKTTIIRCIYAIGNSDLDFFFEPIYDTIEVTAEDERKRLTIVSKDDYVLFNGKKIKQKYIRYFNRGMDIAKKKLVSYVEMEEFSKEKEDYREILSIMKDIFGDVFFISEHRIVGDRTRRSIRYIGERSIEREWIESTEEILDKLEKCMQEAEGNYSQKANELDSTFPERLFIQKEGISEKDFYESLQLMHTRVQKLHNNGFTRMRELKNMEFRREDARALKVYFEDFDSKYREFGGILDRLELFQNIVNRRFRFKRMEISYTRGLVVIDETSGRPIHLSRLSSGEKEIIVLFYNLLFENSDGGFLLIDEPEMSLHIAWQRMFIEDLKKISELRKLTLLIATHSPQIINGNRNIQIDLGELYKNGLNQRK